MKGLQMNKYKTTNNNALIIFAKNPVTNEKLIIPEDFQDKETMNVYLNSLKNVYQQTKDIDSNKFLFLDLAFNHKKYDTGYQICLQYGNDAGMKLYHAFEKIFNIGHDKAVIVAADIPEIKKELIENAYEKLDNYDFVIGPTDEGGFYLLGTKYPSHEIFNNLSLILKTILEDLTDKVLTMRKSCVVLQELSSYNKAEGVNSFVNVRALKNRRN
jgi:glycosyltransferase A (GT-A) superfamily protein (DUF2064 family)